MVLFHIVGKASGIHHNIPFPVCQSLHSPMFSAGYIWDDRVSYDAEFTSSKKGHRLTGSG